MRKIFVDLEMCPILKEYATEKEICKLETIEIGAVMLDEEGKEIASFKEYGTTLRHSPGSFHVPGSAAAIYRMVWRNGLHHFLLE